MNKTFKIIDEFSTCDTWKTRMKYDSIFDKKYRKYLMETINFLNSNPTSEELDNLLRKIRAKSIRGLKKYNASKTLEEKFSNYVEIEKYFGLIESITELSNYSDNVILKIKKVYKNNALNILASVDKLKPSELTNFNFSNINIDKNVLKNKYVKCYLVLKKWQDKQYIFFNKYLDDVGKLEDDYKSFLQKEFINKNYKLRILHLLYELKKYNVLDIRLLTNIYSSGIKDELKDVIGGKGYGLVVLKSNNIEIPTTYFIPFWANTNKLKFSKGNYAIRSSCNVEDGNENSFAGIFDSYLNIKNNDIREKIEKVRKCISNDKVKSYMETKNISGNLNMCVIVQKMIRSKYSGVWIGNKVNSGVYEWIKGLGDNLVSGSVVPNTVICSSKKESGKSIKNQTLSLKFIELQKKLDSICDFEWTIDKNNQLFFLQYRPATTILKIKNNKVKKDSLGLSVSNGKTIGKLCFLKKNDDIKDKDIILAYFTDPKWVPAIKKCSGIITVVGGYLCHTAIIARELSKPCVTNIGLDNLSKIKDYEYVYLNADDGVVKNLLDTKIFIPNNIYIRENSKKIEIWNSKTSKLYGIDDKSFELINEISSKDIDFFKQFTYNKFNKLRELYDLGIIDIM